MQGSKIAAVGSAGCDGADKLGSRDDEKKVEDETEAYEVETAIIGAEILRVYTRMYRDVTSEGFHDLYICLQ